MVIQGPLVPLLSLPVAIIFCDSCICFMVLSLSWLQNHSKLGVSGLCFVYARFPYLFCVTFLCVLRSCSVVVHICMRVIHISPSPSSFLLLLLLTSQLVDVTSCVTFISEKYRNNHAQFLCLIKVLKCTPTSGGYLVVYRLHIASCIVHSWNSTLPLSLPLFIPPHPASLTTLCAGRHWLLHAVGDDDNDDGVGGGGCADDGSVIWVLFIYFFFVSFFYFNLVLILFFTRAYG